MDRARAPPRWWVNTASAVGFRAGAARGSGGTSSVNSALPRLFVPGEAIRVQILVRPASSVSAYASRERFHWLDRDQHHGKRHLGSVNNREMGTVLDNTARELSYDVTPSVDPRAWNSLGQPRSTVGACQSLDNANRV